MAELFTPGSHGSTFGGNPLACRAGLATIDTIETNSLCENAAQLGKYMVDSFNNIFSTSKFVIEVRGKGMMIGIELSTPCNQIVDLCLEKKLLINVTAENVIRLLPPLILEKEQADIIIETIVDCVNTFTESH